MGRTKIYLFNGLACSHQYHQRQQQHEYQHHDHPRVVIMVRMEAEPVVIGSNQFHLPVMSFITRATNSMSFGSVYQWTGGCRQTNSRVLLHWFCISRRHARHISGYFRHFLPVFTTLLTDAYRKEKRSLCAFWESPETQCVWCGK